MDSARHVIGCRLTQDTRVQHAFDDVASTIHQSLRGGVASLGAHRGGRARVCRRLQREDARGCLRGFQGRGRGVIENKHSTDIEYPPHPPCSDLGVRVLVLNDLAVQLGGPVWGGYSEQALDRL